MSEYYCRTKQLKKGDLVRCIYDLVYAKKDDLGVVLSYNKKNGLWKVYWQRIGRKVQIRGEYIEHV